LIRIQVDSLDADRVEVAAAGAHHLSRVLRLGVGDVVQAFDGRGGERTMRLVEVQHGRAVLEAVSDLVLRPATVLDLTVLQALAKGDKLPRIVRAVTELGATRIGLVVTRRTVARPPRERAAGLALRLSRIAAESARQCGRADVPEVRGPDSLEAWLGRPQPALRLAAWEKESEPLAAALPGARPEGITVLVGPEGGFDSAEVDRIRGAGFTTVSLGPRILRTETVAAALCAILQFHYDGLSAPTSAGN
jgi:16S rRNA (uracil1498-N3)-methyltransferase